MVNGMDNKGTILLYAIGAILVIGALSAGVTLMSPSTMNSVLENNCQQQSYYLALTGTNAWQRLQQASNPQTFHVGNAKFTLSYTGSGIGPFTITSVGCANSAHNNETNVYVQSYKSLESPVSDLAQFGPIENTTNAVVVYNPNDATAPAGYDATAWLANWTANATRYGSAWLRFANSQYDTNGAAWYRGTRGFCPGGTCPAGACINGKCGFGNGIRVVFSFLFHDTDISTTSEEAADVMTFAIMNASNNDPALASGGAPSDESLGEYLGYAGLGVHGVGIKPPKIGIEFDTYPNDTRNDSPDRWGYRANHAAVLFWGLRNDAGYADDNYHGAGNGTDSPRNPEYDSTAKLNNKDVGYYKGTLGDGSRKYNWLEDGAVHTARIEIYRNTTTRRYEIKLWVIDGRPAASNAFLDVTTNYPGTGSYSSSLRLDYLMPTAFISSDDTALSQVYFGFTEATGAKTQSADIYGFAAEFIQ